MVNWLDRRLYDWFALFFFLRSEMSEMTAVGCGMGSSGPSKLSPLTPSPSPPKFGLSLILVGNLLVRISGERGASRDLGRQPVGIGPIGLGQLGSAWTFFALVWQVVLLLCTRENNVEFSFPDR